MPMLVLVLAAGEANIMKGSHLHVALGGIRHVKSWL